MIVDGYFVSVSVKGCTFHFAQCIYRRIMHLKLVVTYRDNPSCLLLMKSLMAMPLLLLHSILCEFKRVKMACYAAATKK